MTARGFLPILCSIIRFMGLALSGLILNESHIFYKIYIFLMITTIKICSLGESARALEGSYVHVQHALGDRSIALIPSCYILPHVLSSYVTSQVRHQMPKSQIDGLWMSFSKKALHIMRLRYNKANFAITN